MRKIFVIGAFDRYNYGDLLFPLIIENQLRIHNPIFEFEFFGIINSDLSALGGKPTLDIHQFYERCDRDAKRVSVILAGGEAVAAKWDSLLSALPNNRKLSIVKFYRRYIRRFVNVDSIVLKRLGFRSAFPFLINKAHFNNVDHVILNSLGGSRVSKKLFVENLGFKKDLLQADYFSVRDHTTHNNLRENGIETLVFPDSAILMSKFYPKDKLQALIRPEVKNYVEKKRGQYVFFQSSKKPALDNVTVIANRLSLIASKLNLDICLCPIGKAQAHEDHIGLKAVKDACQFPLIMFEEVTIWDIMYLIANAGVYLGTSLHGVITAMSFDVPYVGLRGAKVNSYLQTWGVKDLNSTVQYDEMVERTEVALQVSTSQLKESRLRQWSEIETSFENMAKILMSK